LRVLLDTCVWGGVRSALSNAGHDVIWAGDWPIDPGDEEILEQAHLEARVLVTLDKDFGELAIVHRMPHHGIVRLVALSTSQQVEMCLAVLAKYASQLEAGAIVTVDARRIRLRPAEDRSE
jgi:predicted nuclease of predicted toxin-antitoxin system